MKYSLKKKAIAFATSAAVENKRLLRNYLRRRLRNPDDLDDLAQEVYLRLLRIQNEERIDSVREPMAYVYTVAASVVADWHRSTNRLAARGMTLEDGGEELNEAMEAIREEDPAERIARQQHIERLLGQLPPIQAAALLLHSRDGFSYEEIAAKLNLSVGMVHYHLTRAKACIRLAPWDKT